MISHSLGSRSVVAATAALSARRSHTFKAFYAVSPLFILPTALTESCCSQTIHALRQPPTGPPEPDELPPTENVSHVQLATLDDNFTNNSLIFDRVILGFYFIDPPRKPITTGYKVLPSIFRWPPSSASPQTPTLGHLGCPGDRDTSTPF